MKVVNVRNYGGIQGAQAAGVVYCGRPSVLGNPFSHLDVKNCVRVSTREEAVERYRHWLWERIRASDQDVMSALNQLADDSVLGCWCAPLSCHCDVIVKAREWLKTKMTDANLKAVAGTGHRPPRLGLGYDKKSSDLLRQFLAEHLERMLTVGPVREVISGMATGFDQALAEAALEVGIDLTAAVAFEGMESKWPADGQRRFYDILGRATRVHTVCEGGYAGWKFIRRDHWMVDNAALVLSLWDGEEKGGTWETVQYARKQGVPLDHLWNVWQDFRAGVSAPGGANARARSVGEAAQ